MIEVLLAVVPSICWIIYRCYQLLQTPVEGLIEDLNIEIPHAPSICIDSVSHTSVVIHWDIETSSDESLIYVLLINNQEAATMSVMSCQLNNLLENKLYQIQVVAINVVTNFRSQSAPVFIETLPKPANQLQGSNALPMITNEGIKVSKVDQIREASKTQLPMYLEAEEIKANQSPEALNKYLLVYQNELCRTKDEYELNHNQLNEEISRLNEESKSYKKKYEQETGSKMRKDINVRDLEKKRDNLTFQKSKIAKELKSFEAMNDIHKSELNDLKNKVKKLTERKLQIKRSEQADRLKIDKQIKKAIQEIELMKTENDSIEDVCKVLTTEKKELTTIFNSLKPFVESFINEVIFTKEGNLTPKATEILDKLYQIQPSWSTDITNEIYNSVNLEINWKSTFRSEIRKFLSIQHSFEIAKVNQDKNYQPLKMSEHQASIEFGGFSNALPKKHKRNFSPLTMLQSPCNEEGNNDQGNEWYDFYGQVYSNDSSDQVQGVPSQRQFSEQLSDQFPSQRVAYDDNVYSQMNNSVINSPVQEDTTLHKDLLNQDLLNPEMNSLLTHNESYYGYQPSLSNLNTVWSSSIDTRIRPDMNANMANSNMANSNMAGSNMANSNMANSNMAGSNMANSNMANSNMANSNMAGSNMANSNMTGSNMANSNMANSNMANSNTTSTLSNTNMSNSNSSLSFGLNNVPADLNHYGDLSGNYTDLQSPYTDLTRLPYNNDINLFNPVLDRSVSSLNYNSYFAPQNPEVDPPTSANTTNNPIRSPIGSLLSPPPHGAQHQKDFGNLWLDKSYSLHNRTVPSSNSQIWRNDLPLGHSHNFNLQLFSSTPSLNKNESDLDLNRDT